MTDRCHCPNEHWQDYPEGGTCGVCGKQTGAQMMIPVTTRLSDYPAIGPGVQVTNQVVGIAPGYTLIADAELSKLQADRKRLELLLNKSYWVKRFRAIGRRRYVVFSDPEHIIASGMTKRAAVDAARMAK